MFERVFARADKAGANTRGTDARSIAPAMVKLALKYRRCLLLFIS
jgi:hypothetical protein